MSLGNANYKISPAAFQWNLARQDLKLFKRTKNLDAFAKYHYVRWPDHPPDPFDVILWKTPDLRRLYNRNSAKHARADKAVGPNGLMTRLFEVLEIPTFFTFPITDLGYSVGDADSKNYQNRTLITDIKENLKQAVSGSTWFTIEVNRKNQIHVHNFAEHDALPFDAFSELIYAPREVYKYLIKGIPYNEVNLATYLKAKQPLPPKKHLVKKAGTVNLPYSKTGLSLV